MNRYFIPVFCCALLALCLVGCGGTALPEESGGLLATPAPSPSSTPAPAMILFGVKPEEPFFQGVKQAVDEAGLRLLQAGDPPVATAFTYDGPGVMLVRLSGEADASAIAAKALLPLFICDTSGGQVPAGVPCLIFDQGDPIRLTLDAAVSFEPHTTPVRMLGLFTAEDSPGHTAYMAAQKDGQVYSQGVYLGTSRTDTAADWLSGQLGRYLPGTVDCIYAETAVLALACAKTLLQSGRDDLEVFSAETSREVFEFMEESTLLAAAAGLDETAAGYESALRAIALLQSRNDTAQKRLAPQVYYADRRTNP